jgi:CTP:molybdopterin cytidylyltransferase MocA
LNKWQLVRTSTRKKLLPQPKKTSRNMFVGLGVNAADSADTTTVLQPGDRPFIDRRSVVFYTDALPVNLGALDRAVAAGVERARGAFAPPVLARIQAGMERSLVAPKKAKEAYRAAARAGLV